MLSKYGSEASMVFDLLGRNEVDLTASVGWVLAHSPMMVTKLGQLPGRSPAALR